jgi:hypothetical protein
MLGKQLKLTVSGGGMMFGVRNPPRMVGNEDKGVKNETNSIVDGL